MLTSYHITILFLSLGVMLFVARGLGELAIALFLLVAGMEVDLSTIWKQGTAPMWG